MIPLARTMEVITPAPPPSGIATVFPPTFPRITLMCSSSPSFEGIFRPTIAST